MDVVATVTAAEHCQQVHFNNSILHVPSSGWLKNILREGKQSCVRIINMCPSPLQSLTISIIYYVKFVIIFFCGAFHHRGHANILSDYKKTNTTF